MFSPDQYELLDFGGGRKLERFGDYILDRPSPAAEGVPQTTRRFQADAAFRKSAKGWSSSINRETWEIDYASFQLELKLTPAGHLGVFPEHSESWDWMSEQIRQRREANEAGVRMLNLFAYTGAATLAAAAAGAAVTHIDAAKNVVSWARRNAKKSDLADAPIRWIAEDATRFVQREQKRGNRYDAVLLDPPSYGHGPQGEVWRVDDDLPKLVQSCFSLLSDSPLFVLLSCHSPGFDAQRLAEIIDLHRPAEGLVHSDSSTLRTVDGRELNCGAFARWTIQP